MQIQTITPGWVYRVRASDGIVYKALVWKACANNMFLVMLLEPLENKEEAQHKVGDKEEVPADNIIGTYTWKASEGPVKMTEYGPEGADGTVEDYHERDISNQADVTILGVDLYIGLDTIAPDGASVKGKFDYTLVLTDPERLGDKAVTVNVYIPIEALSRVERIPRPNTRPQDDSAQVYCDCYYGDPRPIITDNDAPATDL